MKIGTLTKGNMLWQISFRNERKFRAHHDHEELKRFQHLDSAYSRVNRFYSIFNICDERQIDFSGVMTIKRLITRNLATVMDDIALTDSAFEKICVGIEKAWTCFCAGDETSGVVVLARTPEGELENVDEPENGYSLAALSGTETLLIPTDASSDRHKTVVRLRIDLKPAECAASQLGVENVLWADYAGHSLCGLCDCNDVRFDNIDDIPLAMTRALGYEPGDDVAHLLFLAMCKFAPSGEQMTAIPVGRALSGDEVALLVERHDTNARMFHLAFDVGGNYRSVDSLVARRTHRLTATDVWEECDKLERDVRTHVVTNAELNALIPSAKAYGGSETNAVATFYEAVRFAFESGRMDIGAGYDRQRHCEYICALIPIRFENPGVRIRYEREPSAYLCVCHAGKELDFVALVSPAEAARKVRWFNRLKRDFSSEVA